METSACPSGSSLESQAGSCPPNLSSFSALISDHSLQLFRGTRFAQSCFYCWILFVLRRIGVVHRHHLILLHSNRQRPRLRCLLLSRLLCSHRRAACSLFPIK